MSSKEYLCNQCGYWAPPRRTVSDGRTGRMVDLKDGDGPLWTCFDCLPLRDPIIRRQA